MNKSWKNFDNLINSPVLSSKPRRKVSPRVTNASRALAQLKKGYHTSGRISTGNSSCHTSSNDYKIEDASDDENPPLIRPSLQKNEEIIIESCSAPSLDPKDVTICRPSNRLESDIEDVSDCENATELQHADSSDSDSDCESIQCKRTKRMVQLDFRHAKSPGSCGRRITDDTFIVVNATERSPRTTNKRKSVNDITGSENTNLTPESASNRIDKSNSINSNLSEPLLETPIRMRTPGAQNRLKWRNLEESFKESSTANKTKSPRATQKWKLLSDTFNEMNDADNIESPNLTPENSITRVETRVPETPDDMGYFYDASRRFEPPLKFRKGCPVTRLHHALNEKAARQAIWIRERQGEQAKSDQNLIRIEQICRIFGRIAISYWEADADDPGLTVEHVVYIDPGNKQLKMLGKGSLVEIEYDSLPHRLDKGRIVHLGACKIRVVKS